MSRAYSLANWKRRLMASGACLAIVSCVPAPVVPDIETQVAFFNFSRSQYVTIGVRAHGSGQAFRHTSLLAPGATQRSRFVDLAGERCPGSIDVQLLTYRRVNRDVPIGLDPGEVVEPTPVVAAQLDDIPACGVEILETFTIVNWDAPDGTARVKIAQCSAIDVALQASGRVWVTGAWEISGVDPAIAASVQPAPADEAPLGGRVALADGTGVAGVIVVLRTRYRTSLDCANADDPTSTGYSEPIAFTTTDDQGRFGFERPAGVYRLEFYSDSVAFRPGQLDLESPRQDIAVLAEDL